MPTISARAKINLGLEILGRRDDGFHEIRGVFARLELHDTLTIRPAAELGVRWPAGTLAPNDDLIRRAAVLLRERTGSPQRARITLEKSIPMAGGLGGGSSDAAATLFALNEIWRTGLSPSDLAELGVRIGSDVPFFFASATALVSGRGEIVEPIGADLTDWVVLVAPAWIAHAKTAALYGALSRDDFSDGQRTDHIFLSDIRRGSLERAELSNTFERVIDGVFPDWSATRTQLERLSGARFWLTGAGPCLYALFPSEVSAQLALETIRPLEIPALVTRFSDEPLRADP